MADPRDTDPADQDPRERGLRRRSGGTAVGPWVIILLILILGAAVYVVSSMVMR